MTERRDIASFSILLGCEFEKAASMSFYSDPISIWAVSVFDPDGVLCKISNWKSGLCICLKNETILKIETVKEFQIKQGFTVMG
jgi:predicted transcriptional regulator